MLKITNNTIYKGEPALQIKKGGLNWLPNDEVLNKVHFNCGLFKIISTVRKSKLFTGYILDENKVKLVHSFTNGRLVQKMFNPITGDYSNVVELYQKPLNDGFLLWSFETPKGYFVGDEEMAWLFYQKGYKVEPDKDHCHSIALIYEKNSSHSRTHVGYVGFSHRAMVEFRIGDKLFDAQWRPGIEDKRNIESISFTQRGSRTIVSLSQAREAAINFAEYVS